MTMKKIFSLIIAFIIISMATSAQSIFPNENTEFCPLTSTTFTVTLPRIASGTTPTVASWTNGPILISGVSNLSHTSTQTTFSFVGQFRDVNINQQFKIDYTPNGGSASSYYPSFKRVKSLFYNTNCAQIPNQGTITAPRCQISNFNINFSNVKWGTAFENPDLCFSSITNYEYRLPANWILNGQTSTGTNWIAGSNNVTVTSDLSTGDGTTILIRPVNNCGSNLVNGQIPGQISVSRPAPLLSISSSSTVICSGSSTHRIVGMPSGATVQWSIDNTTDAGISNPNATSVTLTRLTTANSFVNLTATVTHCTFTYTVSRQIVLGTLYATHDIVAHYPSVERNCFTTFSFLYFQANFTGGWQPNQYQWSYRPTGTTTETSVPGNSNVAGYFMFYSSGNYDIIVRTGNQCGITSETIRTIEVCDEMGGGWEPRMVLYPNPAKTDVLVSFENLVQESSYGESKNSKLSFELVNTFSGHRVKQWHEPSDQKQYKLSLKGIQKGQYYLTTTVNGKKISKQIFIE